jgi:lipopolysaccharide export system protein LptC
MAHPATELSGAMDGEARRRVDVAARTRTTVSEAKRYTKFVGVMKRVLLIAALALLAAVLAYSLQPRRKDRVAITVQKLGVVNNDLAMIKPRLTGTDAKGSPYVVTADRAIQDAKDTHRARLQNVEADLTTRTGGWISISAPHGYLDANAHKLDLNGAIAMFTDSGYEAHTDLANIDLARGIVVGPHHVTGQGPLGTFVADRFRVEKANAGCAPKKAAKPGTKAKAGAKAAASCAAQASAPDASDSKIYLFGNVHMSIDENRSKKKKK